MLFRETELGQPGLKQESSQAKGQAVGKDLHASESAATKVWSS